MDYMIKIHKFNAAFYKQQPFFILFLQLAYTSPILHANILVSLVTTMTNSLASLQSSILF